MAKLGVNTNHHDLNLREDLLPKEISKISFFRFLYIISLGKEILTISRKSINY